MEKALAERVHRLPSLTEVTVVTRVPEGILAGVRQALLSGETHYTARPGIPELRAKVAERLALSDRTADEVIITSGEREAIFVARLALGLDPLSLREGLPSSVIVGDARRPPGSLQLSGGFRLRTQGSSPPRSGLGSKRFRFAPPLRRRERLLWRSPNEA